MIGAGKLDRKVTIQDYTKTKDAFGQEVETWQDVVTVPCGKKDLISTSTQEASEAAQEQTKTTSEFTIRYYAGLEGNYRLKFENEIYENIWFYCNECTTFNRANSCDQMLLSTGDNHRIFSVELNIYWRF